MRPFRLYFLATLLLLAAGQSAWATATTKTVTYTLSREKDNNNEYWVLTHSGSTPFDQTTTVDRQPTTGTSATFQLPDGFIFTFNWKGGMVTKVSPSGDFFCTDNPQFNLVWDFTSRYVTKVSVTANDGTVTALDGGGSASTDHVCLEHGPVSYTAAGNAYFAKLVITYTDVPNLNIFTQLGDKIYEIKSKDDLRYLAEFVNNGEDMNTGNRTFRQTQDITFTYTTAWDDPSSEENNYIAIGTAAKDFWGTYDGQGHTISGIRIYRADVSNQGLFGKIYNGTVRGVKLADARITGKLYVGGIVGNMSGSTVEDCAVTDDVCIHAVMDQSNYHGGIVGSSISVSTVQRCLSQATLTIANASGFQYYYYGAIVGSNNKTVNDCIAVDATVPGVTSAGAIIGVDASGSTIQRNYYRACTVAGTSNATGVGVGYYSNNSTLHDVTANQGAQALYRLTLPSGVTLDRTASATLPGTGNATYTTGADIEGTPYAFSGATLSLSYTGGSGAGVAYTVTKTSDGSDVTADVLSGTTLTMPAYDVMVANTLTLTGALSGGFYWATWFSHARYSLPEGATAYTMDAEHHLYRLGDNGRVIPAGVAVVIISDKESITLTYDGGSSTIIDHSGGNILHGGPVSLDGNHKVPVPGSDPEVKGYPYVLSLSGNPATIGFRQYTGTDAIPAGKAYYIKTD